MYKTISLGSRVSSISFESLSCTYGGYHLNGELVIWYTAHIKIQADKMEIGLLIEMDGTIWL